MNTNRIFLGNVMCGKELIGQMVLLQCKEDLYVALDNVETFMDVFKISHNQSNLMTLSTVSDGYYYVDKSSLKPYYEKRKQKTLKRIKRDVLLDSRNPSGINH